MEGWTLLLTIGFSLLPISELRGAIPFAYFNGVPLGQAYIISTAANALVGPLVYLFLSTFHHLFSRMAWYRSFFARTVAHARKKTEAKVRKYGYWGVMLFVAVPLPITGAYTGTLGAWILGLDRKRTCLAVIGGVLISGAIVSAILFFGIKPLSIFLKNM